MSMKRWMMTGVLGCTLVAPIFSPFMPAWAQETKSGGDAVRQTDRSRADAAWDEKSYARALELYRALLPNASEAEREEITFRIAVSRGKTEQWDAAIGAGQNLLQSATWKARVSYWMGRLYTIVPDEAYKVGAKYYYGADYPKIVGAEKPEPTYIGEENSQATLKYFEEAKVQAQRERDLMTRARFAAPTHPLTNAEEIDLNFDLAATLSEQQADDLIASLDAKKTLSEVVDVSKPYDRMANMAQKILYLYNEIPRLDDSKDKRDSTLALLGKGLWIRGYRGRMDAWAHQEDEKTKKPIVRAYPFDHLEAIPVWRELVAKFPDSDLAPQTQLLIAQSFQQQNALVKARVEAVALIAKFPRSKWADDARAVVQQIDRHEINLDTMGAQPPGKAAKLTINARNIRDIEFRAYPIALEKFLTQRDNVQSPTISFTNFEGNFGTIDSIIKVLGAPAAKWTVRTKDKADHQGVTETLDTPLQKLGAYLIVARDKSPQSTLRAARLLLVSDLAILKKVDRNSAFAFLADARSGQAVEGVNAVVKEIYRVKDENLVDAVTSKSNDGGFVDKKLVRQQSGDSSGISVFAWSGKRYALTGNFSGDGMPQMPWWGYNNGQNSYKIYSYTDRPLYRPAQKVYFRHLLSMQTRGGDQIVARNRKVKVTVANPKGETIWDKTFTSSEFGTVNGDFDLPTETPLGEYAITARVLNEKGERVSSGGARFRVEEYKRPEFEVSIEAPDIAVQPGETVAAKIKAKYYFGSPVANATVKYTVRRRTWWADYRFPTDYDWLFNSWDVSWNPWDNERRNIGGDGSGDIVKEGTVKTDAQGNAELSFVATPDPDAADDEDDWWLRYSNPLYVIEAEVTDSSRRTIEGSGQVKVANQQYFAFLNPQRGYYTSGDRVQIEVVTQDANDKPVSASGKMVVYRLLDVNKVLPNEDAVGNFGIGNGNFATTTTTTISDTPVAKRREEKVFEEAVQTDEHGKLFWTWPSDNAGQFRIVWEATDAWNQAVKAETTLWINGPQLNQTQFRQAGLTIVLDKRYYAEGDTAKVLLVADKPNTTVLLTQESSGEILRRDVIAIQGKSREIEIPITHDKVPNFALAAALVKDYEVFQAQQEIFVPPVRALLNVKVTGDKAQYKPGETGTFAISATDYAGQPARAEVSLAAIDASLFYIQRDTAPDIRPFFYGERRPINVNLDSSRSGNGEARLEDLKKYQTYKTHGWTLPDDFGQLNLDPSGGFGGYDNYYGLADSTVRYRSAMPAVMLPAQSMSASAGEARYESDGNGYPGSAGGAIAQLAPARRRMRREAKEPQLAEAKTRSNFAETAFWAPAVVTENGKATVKVTFPDSLTQWHVSSRGLTPRAQVGAAESDVETKKNLLVRLQAPRFFVEKDQVILTANVHNYLPTAKRVKVALQIGDALKLNLTKMASLAQGTNLSAKDGWIEIKPGEEQRVNWTIDVVKDGQASVKMIAQSDEESDAVEMKFPVLVHGAQRFAAQAGVLRDGKAQVVHINFPKERKFGTSTLNVQLNPSLAAQMLDALPYLADYPYGCVEQTTSRFVPAVLVAKTLRDAGIDLDALRRRAKAYQAEAQTPALGARVQNTGYTYPKGQPNARDLKQMSSHLYYHGRTNNPIYDPKVLSSMIEEGLQRLYAMQRGDGGWGWWQGSQQSDEYMSSYVMYGLATARDAGVKVRPEVLSRGFAYLEKQMLDEDNIHELANIAHSLSLRGPAGASKLSDKARDIIAGRLFTQRERLTAYSKSLLAMALWNIGEKQKAGVLVRNLENTAKIDAENQTAHWKLGDQYWWWWNNDTETNATALRAILLIEPKNKLAPMLTQWLTVKARAGHWQSTKDSALAVYALADYVRINRELDVDYTLKVLLNNRIARTYRVTAQNALYFDNRFIVGDLFLQNGANTLTIQKTGRGNLYWNASSEYFSLEMPIKASGNEIAVKRRFFKLTRNPNVKAEQSDAVSTTTTTEIAAAKIAPPLPRPQSKPNEQEYKRAEIADEAMLQSGDLVEVELTIDAKNDYEYLVFEDMKAAGLEAQDIRSGGAWGDGLSSNVELRDEKVAFFVDHLPQGTRVLRYRMRVEIPGRFHALPTNGYAMYAPEVRAISDEMRIGARD